METKATLCVPVLDVLDKDNYLDWSVRVKTYLMAQDLWDIIDQELTNENPKHGDDEATFRKWSKKNSMVLHVIQNSCGPDTFYHIRNITSAKSAWDTLAQKYEVLPDQNTSSVGLEKNNYEGWSARVKANLMAQDVWDIVEATTEAPKEEDAFKAAWSKKNSLALNVIQNSCGLDTFYQIRKITSAKSAWNTLEKKYKVPGTTSSVGRDVVLDKDNYEGWSASLKANLMAQDHLWVDIFEATSEAPKEEDEDAFKEWSKKNSLALTVIQNSCGPDAKSKIKEISLAKDAWDALAIEYKEPKLGLILHDALKIGRWKNVKTILDKHRKEFPALLRAKITSGGETALHIAVTFGYDQIVKELVAQMTEEDLLITDDDSYTALMSAVVRGRDVQVRCMLGKNRKLSDIKTDDGILPVYMAMYSGQVKIAKYLFYNTPPQAVLNIRKPPSDQKDMKNGAKLCVLAVASEHFDIALSLIQDYCNCLAFADNGEGRTPLLELASKPHAFPSGNRFVFWKQWIYKCIGGQAVPVPPVPTTKAMASNETLVSIPNEDHRGEHDQVDRSIGSAPTSLYHVLFSKVWNFVDGTVLGIRQLYETKRIHQQSEELLGHICSRIPYLNNEERKVGSINEAIMSAVKNGITEIVVEMLQADLELQWERDEMCRNIFWVAILHRQSKIFKIIFMLDLKKALMNIKDNDKNCILHMAGMVGDSTVLDRIPGAALQMQRELQWFKELESIVPRTLTEATNNDDLTPWQLFKKNHMNLKKEGERWMKDTSTSCTVVGALIITIMFAAAITFPGGIDQNTGLPFLLNDELFILFIISDAFSLFSATTSVLMFLGILTSRYAEVDFLVSLPRKMIIGLSTLCFSIAAMMTSFSAILLIMLRGHPLYRQTWIISVAICLASIPVTLFVLMQFPLLVVMFISTYCRRIVDRKLKHCFN